MVVHDFAPYVDELERLSCSVGANELEEIAPHLDGEVSRRLRRAVPIDELRALGAFFTRGPLAARLLAHAPTESRSFADPACGCGDLLLAASARLPASTSLRATLVQWNEQLVGRDLVPGFVRAARARLVLAAIARGCVRDDGLERPADLLTNIRVGNGLKEPIPEGIAVVVNPPFGYVPASNECKWASGLTTHAGIFLDELLESCARGNWVGAILPDVLRAGSRYGRFRAAVEERFHIECIELAGIFDSTTDVDVFLLVGRTGVDRSPGSRWTAEPPDSRLGEICDVRVGPVVANRDPHAGPWRAYLDARDAGGARELVPARRRRFKGAVLDPPFVVVGRTNRASRNSGPRLKATIIRGDRSVAVENHLVVLVPQAQTLSGCRDLVKLLESERASSFLDERLRCRHLTVEAIAELPR